MVFEGAMGGKTRTMRLHCPMSPAFNSRGYSKAVSVITQVTNSVPLPMAV